jgi:hypothetical protein
MAMKRFNDPIEPMDLANMRDNGVRSLSVSCWQCHNEKIINVDHWPGDLTVKSFEPRMVCTKCGTVGADVRPGELVSADTKTFRVMFALNGKTYTEKLGRVGEMTLEEARRCAASYRTLAATALTHAIQKGRRCVLAPCAFLACWRIAPVACSATAGVSRVHCSLKVWMS